MPIHYQIDRERRLVTGSARGTVTPEDVLAYQQEVWSRPELAGYNELVDMSQVAEIVGPSTKQVKELASLSAGMDRPSSASRFAIVAPTDFAFALARMYEAYRNLDERSSKQVGVFRTREEALAFLGISGD